MNRRGFLQSLAGLAAARHRSVHGLMRRLLQYLTPYRVKHQGDWIPKEIMRRWLVFVVCDDTRAQALIFWLPSWRWQWAFHLNRFCWWRLALIWQWNPAQGDWFRCDWLPYPDVDDKEIA